MPPSASRAATSPSTASPPCGTIFEIYLPRVPDADAPPAAAVPAVFSHGSETILLVDDEEGVRTLVRSVLEESGYAVLEATNAAAALAAWEKNAHKVDLVLLPTWLCLPPTASNSGRQLHARAAALRILYMSGYRDHPDGIPAEFVQEAVYAGNAAGPRPRRAGPLAGYCFRAR